MKKYFIFFAAVLAFYLAYCFFKRKGVTAPLASSDTPQSDVSTGNLLTDPLQATRRDNNGTLPPLDDPSLQVPQFNTALQFIN